jgi:pyruvate/2-oxoglutarate dehydrogenase complex dihydrolipoamide dehydrogenase (E3) component
MTKTDYDVDICIIGAGSAGLSVASGAAQLGRSVVLFEANEMGGDCLNSGCVPSKSLIAAGKAAHAQTSGEKYGIKPVTPKIDFEAVKAHVKGVIEQIAPVDSQERFEGLGCIVIREYAHFTNEKTVESDSTRVKAKRFVIATGSRASAPPIPGLEDTPYLTNETIFDVDRLPEHLVIIGAGPIGFELGQTFRRLGSEVTIIDVAAPLGRNEPEHAKILIEALESEGVKFLTPAKTKQIKSKKYKTKSGVSVELEDGTKIDGSHLLVAAGRTPALERLTLEKANVKYDKKGIETDEALRTSNSRVYAAGDVVKGMGGLTHAAGFHAGQLIKNFYFMPPLLGRFFAKAAIERMPAAIYSEPELANIGLSEKEAREQHGDDIKTVSWEFEENDRAMAERKTEGGIKIVATRKGKVLGASIVGDGAGEIIQMLSLAMASGVKISGLAQFISPYPTRTEIVKRAAGSWYTDTIFSEKTRKLAGILTKFQ